MYVDVNEWLEKKYSKQKEKFSLKTAVDFLDYFGNTFADIGAYVKSEKNIAG